jgi:type I restriction enzyme S subunit
MSLELLLGQWDEVIQTPDDINRLNATILQWAVQGKLVPQCADDEPAAALLERIVIQKESLIERKQIRNEIPQAGIEEDEEPFKIPKGWAWERLGNICFQITDGTHHTPKYVDIGIPFLSVKDISGGFLDFSNTRFITEEEHHELIKRCNPEFGDVLLTKVGTTGIAKVVDTQKEFSIFVSVALLKFAQNEIFPWFLEYLINSPLVKEQSDRFTMGVGNKNLVLKYIKNFVVPIPPYTEQKRIVAKVDELFEQTKALAVQMEKAQAQQRRVHQAVVHQLAQTATPITPAWQIITRQFDTLYQHPANIAELKQTILQLAVQGRLVPQDEKDEDAAALLERICEERESLIQAGKIKKVEKLPPIREEDQPYLLPKGWAWARFPELGELNRGKSKHRPRNDVRLYKDGRYPFVQTGEVARSNGLITFYSQKYSEFGLAQSRMWPAGTLCITIAANIAETGILGFDACFPDSIVGFIPSPLIGSVEYFLYFVQVAKKQLEEYAPATAQKNINLGILQDMLIPVPPAGEITRIVAKVEELLALCDQLTTHTSTATSARLRLRDALLAG